jgi:predicted PurR-regulated permease PerM
MQEPAPQTPDAPALDPARWVASLPPPPFVDPAAAPGRSRFVPLSPRVAVLIVAAIVIGLLLWMARDSVRPFVVGLLFVYLLDPPVRWLVRRGVRRSIAILIVYVVAIVAFVEFLALTLTPLVNEIMRFIADFPKLAENLDLQLQRLGEFYARLQIPAAIREWIDGVIAGIGQGGSVGGGLDLTFLLPLLTGAGSLLGLVFGYLILPVWVFYLLKDKVALVATFDRSLPPAWRFDTWAIIKTVEHDFGQWVRGQLILGFAVGVFTFIGLIVLSYLVDPIFGRYALLLSIIAGVLELVPIIGPIISAVPAVLLAATVGPAAVVAALLLYTLVQQIENNVFVPKIQGDAIQLHPAAVIFAIIIGGALAGLLGAILALPMTAAFRDIVRYLFRRLSPDEPEALVASLKPIGMGPTDGWTDG